MNFERKLIRKVWTLVRKEKMREMRQTEEGLRLNRKDFRSHFKGSRLINYQQFDSLARQ